MATPTSLPATFVAGNVLTAAQMNNLRGAFRILQVVSTTKDDTFTSSSTSFTDITGLSATITPSSTDSEILVLANVKGSSDNGTSASSFFYRLVRGATAISVGAAAGSRTRATGALGTRLTGSAFILHSDTVVYLDSPNTTSATTYKVQGLTGAGTFYLNRRETDTDSSTSPRTVSSITLLEVSA